MHILGLTARASVGGKFLSPIDVDSAAARFAFRHTRGIHRHAERALDFVHM